MASREPPRSPLAGLLVMLALLVGCGSASHARSPATVTRPVGPLAIGPRSHPSGALGSSSQALSEARTRIAQRELRRLIALGKPIYCAGRRGNELALTFDDGPGPYTRLVIVKLRKHHIGATFFIVGRNIALDPQATRQERSLGAVGDHTFSHPMLTALGPAQAETEIARTQAALARSSGGKVFLFRPPYGAHDARIDAIARAHGLLEILWNVDSRDSLGANYAQIERTVIAGMRAGAIILMHENHGQTVRALLNIFAALVRKRLRAVSVPQLLADDPPSLARVRAGALGCGAGGSTLTGG